MDYVEIGYILNYIPKVITTSIADDDQIASWAMQAWRKLNFTKQRYVKDISFLEVKNHKTKLPTNLKRIVNIAVNTSEPTNEELDAICDAIPLPANNSFAAPCSIAYKAFINCDYYKNRWEPVSHVGNLAEDYLCRIDHTYPNHVYSTRQGSDILTFDFLEGVVAVEHWANPTDDFGNILLPREPDVLWQYLAAYVRMQYWANETALGTANAFQLYQDAKLEQAGYYQGAKQWFMIQNYDIVTAREQIYGPIRYIKLPTFIHRHYSSRNNNERTLLK